MTLVSDPDLLVVNVVVAPTAEDLEAEGGGEEDEAGEAAADEETSEEGESDSSSESDSE